ncbi:hypothetical protein K2173_001245 [Erythroxylum novogranatense]|uniref:Uncharacterized protein n=1 Tax=Erythroxylum novogranatense TaxID=1862640 RepID=A0AAV8T4Z6_9ROSI|nr:hypothetical protein K2173_001245 [Erythroxylum novogranatense]
MATNRDRPGVGVGAQKYGNESDDQGSNSLITYTSQHSSHSRNLAAAAATAFRFLRMEWEEMEMIKAREISRWEGQKRRMEAEAELTQMMLQTQLLVAGRVVGRERKRVDDEESDEPLSAREEALLFSLLQCSFSF